MNKFLFVLGSNWQLSIAELDNILKNSNFKGKITDYSANIAIVEFDTLHEDEYYINQLEELQFILGGCQKIAKIYDFINLKTIRDAFPYELRNFKQVERNRTKILNLIQNLLIGKEQIFPNVDQSMFFAISIYPNLFDDEYYSRVLLKHFLPFLNKEIMDLLKQLGAEKVLYYKYPEKNIIKGNLNPLFPHHLIKYELFSPNRAEIIFGFTEEGVYIGRTFTADDPNFKKKIDEERPFTEFKSAISPKLSLMLLNFLNLFENREEKIIIDPFVGNGTILLFALLQDFQVYGSDIDQNKVNNTIRNINWMLDELEEPVIPLIREHIKRKDVKDLSKSNELEYFDGIVTEPPLGPYFTKEKPYYIEAKNIIENELEPIYRVLFEEAYKILKPGARLALIAPLISTIDGDDVQIDVEAIASQLRFKLIPLLNTERITNKSNIKLQLQKDQTKKLIDAKKGQVVMRKIFVFEKKVK